MRGTDSSQELKEGSKRLGRGGPGRGRVVGRDLGVWGEETWLGKARVRQRCASGGHGWQEGFTRGGAAMFSPGVLGVWGG